jgi:hypothetical protein
MKQIILIFSFCLACQTIFPQEENYGAGGFTDLSYAAAGGYSLLLYPSGPAHVIAAGGFIFFRFMTPDYWGIGVSGGFNLNLLNTSGLSTNFPCVINATLGPCFTIPFPGQSAAFHIMPGIHAAMANEYGLYGAGRRWNLLFWLRRRSVSAPA